MPQHGVLALLVYDMFFIPLLAFSSGPRTFYNELYLSQRLGHPVSVALCAIQDKLERRQKL